MTMKRLIIICAIGALCACSGKAEKDGKQIFTPKELAENGGFDNPENNYSYARSQQSDNLIVFWEKGFGDDPATAPKYKEFDMTVDIPDLIRQSEGFYGFFRDSLKFIQKGSNADKYKMMVMLNYSDEGTAYGGDYDMTIGALWVTPLRTKDKRLNAIAHELGHSFQSQLCIDNKGGFDGGGIFEMTSQWMLWQVNPLWMDDETYHWDAFMKQTHLAFMHPENMYHSPYVLEYWSGKRGKDFIADLWRSAKSRHDVVEVYKDFTNQTQAQFNDEMYDACAHFINYDLPRVKEVAAKYANRHSCELDAADAEGWCRIAESRTPQQYGYNAIQLTAPKAGETVSVDFKGLSEDAAAGWRYGLVGTKESGEIVYGDMHSEKEGKVSLTADEPYSYLWLVVMAAPTENQQLREEQAADYKEFPYAIKM